MAATLLELDVSKLPDFDEDFINDDGEESVLWN